MSRPKSVIMVGATDSGKTSYLGRLWAALAEERASLRSTQMPDEVGYAIRALEYLQKGQFAPRTDVNIAADGKDGVTVDVEWNEDEKVRRAEILVPDVAGELWVTAIRESEMPEPWFDRLCSASGALLFVRVSSKEHVESLDWATAAEPLKAVGKDGDYRIPTDVQLCEFLRMLETFLGQKNGCVEKPRVAVLISAWDMLDESVSRHGPRRFLQQSFRLFSGRIADVSTVEISVFGLSVVGGDLEGDPHFREQFLNGRVENFGYVITESGQKWPDVTTPIRWVLDGNGEDE